MALSLPSGITPPELAFLCEMELVTVIPRQRMDSLPLLSGPTPPLHPNRSTPLPLHLALLLHSQRRATILPPPWLSPPSLEAILTTELESDVFSPNPVFPSQRQLSQSKSLSGYNYNPDYDFVSSPPFLLSSTTDTQYGRGKEGRLPYHWLELAEMLLASTPESFVNFASLKGTSGPETVRRLLRDIREVRKAKLREGMKALEGGGVVSLRGVGGMEVAEERGYVVGIVDGLRAVGASREGTRRENGEDGGTERGADEDGDDMDL